MVFAGRTSRRLPLPELKEVRLSALTQGPRSMARAAQAPRSEVGLLEELMIRSSPKRWALPAAVVLLLAAMPAAAVGGFSPSLFRFRVTVKDDGKKDSGGWQEATTELSFVDARLLLPKAWSCRVTVGMPLRAAAYGRLSADVAADVSASVATEASHDVIHRRPEWLTAEFCVEFFSEMRSLFKNNYLGLGVRVNGL
jgi:hypothetical protein